MQNGPIAERRESALVAHGIFDDEFGRVASTEMDQPPLYGWWFCVPASFAPAQAHVPD